VDVLDIRPTTDADLGQVLSVTTTEPVDWVDADRYRAGLATGEYRPGWTWLALDGDQVIGRAVWWAPPDARQPVQLDCLVVDPRVPNRVRLGQQLLAAAHTAFREAGAADLPDFEQVLQPDFRTDPPVAAATAWRELAVRRAGLTDRVERVAMQWSAGTPLPPPSGDLSIEAEPDDDVILDALQWVAVGSLDVATRRGLVELGPEKQARDDLDFFYAAAGARGWWRTAWTWHGRLVGVAIPSALADGTRTVGYVGVLPEFRGRRYVDDLLGYVTRFAAEAGARRVVAATETANSPMIAALVRSGYRNSGLRVVHSAPPA